MAMESNKWDRGPPVDCFESCNAAYIEALSVGKTTQLCDTGSVFSDLFFRCTVCIRANRGGNSDPGGIYTDEKLGQFLDFCGLPNLELRTSVVTLRDGSDSTVTYVTEVGPSTSSELSPTSSLPAATSESTASTPSRTPSATSPPSTTTTESDDQSSSHDSKAWIAGAVIGPVVAIVIAIVVACWMRRRWKAKLADARKPPSIYDKAQLHSDCLPAKTQGLQEAESRNLHEMEGSSPQPVEMRANEVPAREMAAP